MAALAKAASSLRVEPPPEDVWDTFLDSVYNRMERRTGWIFFVLGVIVMVAVVAFMFVSDPRVPPVRLSEAVGMEAVWELVRGEEALAQRKRAVENA